MMKNLLFCVLLVFLVACSPEIKVKVVPRSAEEMVKINIVSPQEEEIIDSDTARIIFTVENFRVSVGGNAVHVVLNNGPIIKYFGNGSLVLSSLAEGRNVVRIFPAKGWGESVKDMDAFVMRQFYVKKKNSELLNVNAPMLTYNEPAGFYSSVEAKRLLLDFLVHNVVLSKNGYRVRYSLDGVSRELFAAQPVYLTNVGSGAHKVVLELVDKNGNLAEGNFVRTQRDFVVMEEKTKP
ncbi:hypothetical protein HY485_05055 [Candidatus Woesearchaeota archaeon]|nr:hypothetical protein [Candidatus Woesearchaeota archaeon]